MNNGLKRANYFVWNRDEITIIANEKIFIHGGPGSGNFGHRGRPGQVGGSGTGSRKVWIGRQQEGEVELGRLEYAKLGEEMVMKIFSEQYGVPFETLNVGIVNSPIDVMGDHTAIEVKTGLATNSRDGQRWRATIGQPGKREAALLKQMGPEEKRKWNDKKETLIIKRKNNLLSKMEKQSGRKIKPLTVGLIMSPDGRRFDAFAIPGFHLELRWSRYATDEYYIGTYNV